MSAAVPARTDTTTQVVERNIKRRLVRDAWFRRVMTFGGLSVIIAISLIFFYLASVVAPLFLPAHLGEVRGMKPAAVQPAQVTGLRLDELREVIAQYGGEGTIRFFSYANGAPLGEQRISLPEGVKVTAFGSGEAAYRFNAYGLSDGRIVVFRQAFEVTFPNDKRVVTPKLEFPLGEAPLALDEQGASIVKLSVQAEGEKLAAAALTADGRVVFAALEGSKNLITGEVTLERSGAPIPAVEGSVQDLFLEVKRRELLVVHGERFISQFSVENRAQPVLMSRFEPLPRGERITAAAVLSGGYSIVVGGDQGSLVQWFGVRNAENVPVMTPIRDFAPMPAAVTTLTAEHFRKGFAAGDERGNVGIYYATSRRLVADERFSEQPIDLIEIAPRANGLVVTDRGGQVRLADLKNEYPEVSFSSLWQKVWYEGYEKPEYLWQSSAATSDFEAKFSLAPLTFGTLKAAFYAMLVSIPLAILGAIYAAYFMSARLRAVVKPSIEIMEALPTVILGFLAGLWLAPLADNNLPAVLLCFVVIPVFILLAAYVWHRLPSGLTLRVAPGWEAALLLPVVTFAIWFCFQIGHPIEVALFNGDMPNWLSNEVGITYEQRNSLVVGIAMGFAVTPTIFSIAEDAIFQVPRHLTSGSLALGATPWQTLTRVVLLTASPGIFSAVMIGLGRAVGETMIVLMATGNTAVMDFGIFTGFRTLSANIGVEMPEAAVGSTHYRLLFLSALVLFVFTFVVNTVAELVRHRLREKYSSI
jgi:phosphate transport system permease protein